MKMAIIFALVITAIVSSLGQVVSDQVNVPLPAWPTYRAAFDPMVSSYKMISASGCNASGCHGAGQAASGKFRRIEYHVWLDQGNGTHFRAFKSLSGERAESMVKILYPKKPNAAEQSECLACHAMDVDEKLRTPAYEIEDGVTCEACHGRAEKWLSPHQFQESWRARSPDERKQLGFYDLITPVHRAERCLKCHLGTAEEEVTHAMLAAGHPPLTFELVHDLKLVPVHWEEDAAAYLDSNEGGWFTARLWAVGQAVTLRESMYRLRHWVKESNTIDFAVFECYACHHDQPRPLGGSSAASRRSRASRSSIFPHGRCARRLRTWSRPTTRRN